MSELKNILMELQLFIQDFNTASIIIRLFLAVCFGGLIGLDREKNHSAAGLRTIAIVCLGSCLVIIVNEYLRIKSAYKKAPFARCFYCVNSFAVHVPDKLLCCLATHRDRGRW